MSIRLLAAPACELDLDLCHFDAKQAFVQSDLDEVVYIRLPPGCGALSGKVVRLRRSLYGLKQASRTLGLCSLGAYFSAPKRKKIGFFFFRRRLVMVFGGQITFSTPQKVFSAAFFFFPA